MTKEAPRNRPGRPGHPASPARARAGAAALFGLAALAAAGLSAWPPWLAVALAAAPVGLWLAAGWPAQLLAALLIGVLLQDALVGLGLGWLQAADEALVLAGCAGLAFRAWQQRSLARTPLDIPSLCLLASGLAATLLRPVPAIVAALGGLALFKGILAWQLGARLDPHPSRLEGVLEGLAWSTAAFGLIAVVQRIGGEPIFAAMGRMDAYLRFGGGKAPSIFFNHNALGHVLVLGGALALGLALEGAPNARRGMAAAGLACLAGLLVSASREGWLGAAAGLMLAALLLRSRRLLRVGLLSSLILLAGGALVYSSSETMRSEIARRTAGVTSGWQDFQLGFTGRRYRGEYRVYVILKSAEIWLDQPWLGTGPGRFGGQVALSHASPIYEQYDFLPLDGVHIPLDVFWSRLLTEWGLLGSLCFAWAFVLVLLSCLRAARAPDPLARALGLGGIVAWGAVLVFGVFAPALEDPLTAIPFWAWGGLAWRLGSGTDLGAARSAPASSASRDRKAGSRRPPARGVVDGSV